jgi:protein-disulfide isomerase
MRLNGMNRLLIAIAGVAFALPGVVSPLNAQRAVPPGSGQTFKDMSMIKPPPGAKVAIFEFEDLECPACAQAHPIVLQAVEHYKVPFIRKDFPWPFHKWSTDAAIWARYLQDKVSAKAADDYRSAVFAAQVSIASRDDLMNFTRRYFQSHNLQMPFVIDPTGQFRKEVMDDRAFGDRMGVSSTPTIIVCTDHTWVQVTQVSQLYQTIEAVQSQAASAPVVKKVSH